MITRRPRFIPLLSATAFGVSAFALAGSARATEQDIFNATTLPGKSPQRFALELRISPYHPDIDSESALSGKTPYKDTFGDAPRVLVGAEFDWQVVRIPWVGTLGPGLSLSYTEMSAKSFTLAGGRSAEDTKLEVFPMYLVAVVRADVFWVKYHVPIVPYAKAGFGATYWQTSNPGGTSEATNAAGTIQTKGHGMTWGTQWAGGVAIALDAIDAGASRNLDNTVGINNTYLYGEYYLAALNGLNQQHPLLVGTNTWVLGLAFEF